ncbi:MAG: molybdopterin-synthase adenylyltransferase MoeB [Betaproteobacteria bacterium]
MNDEQLLRYSRHILLDEIGVEGQQRLLAAHALIIGAGGLGSPAGLYLGSAGLGCITVVDHDRVDATNLQRQIAHAMDRVGHFKCESLAQSIAQINPEVQVHCVTERADAALLARLVPQASVVLDCTDNFATRQAINRACVEHHVPLVSGAAIGFDAQLSVYDSGADGPCYACLFSPHAPPEEVRCATMGVFAPLVGIIGSMQAAEALKLILGIGPALAGRLLMLDGRSMQCSEIALRRDAQCSVCAKH